MVTKYKSDQDWSIGKEVKIGFMANLEIVSIELTPGDSMPDIYHLVSKTGIKYTFTPHYGLKRE